MKLKGLLAPVFTSLAVILAGFIAISIFDIIIAVIYSRFYTNAAFITIFGVGGIFAGMMSYSSGLEMSKDKNPASRIKVTGLIVVTGLIFYFFLARIEGGEYEAAFKSYGVTTALSSLFMARWKID